jgi:hypothetical protein
VRGVRRFVRRLTRAAWVAPGLCPSSSVRPMGVQRNLDARWRAPNLSREGSSYSGAAWCEAPGSSFILLKFR